MKTQKQNTAVTVQNWKKVLMLAVVMLTIVGGSNMIFAQSYANYYDVFDDFSYPEIKDDCAITVYKYYIKESNTEAAIAAAILGFQYCYEKTYTPKYFIVGVMHNSYKMTAYMVERKYYKQWLNGTISNYEFADKIIKETSYY